MIKHFYYILSIFLLTGNVYLFSARTRATHTNENSSINSNTTIGGGIQKKSTKKSKKHEERTIREKGIIRNDWKLITTLYIQKKTEVGLSQEEKLQHRALIQATMYRLNVLLKPDRTEKEETLFKEHMFGFLNYRNTVQGGWLEYEQWKKFNELRADIDKDQGESNNSMNNSSTHSCKKLRKITISEEFTFNEARSTLENLVPEHQLDDQEKLSDSQNLVLKHVKHILDNTDREYIHRYLRQLNRDCKKINQRSI